MFLLALLSLLFLRKTSLGAQLSLQLHQVWASSLHGAQVGIALDSPAWWSACWWLFAKDRIALVGWCAIVLGCARRQRQQSSPGLVSSALLVHGVQGASFSAAKTSLRRCAGCVTPSWRLQSLSQLTVAVVPRGQLVKRVNGRNVGEPRGPVRSALHI